MVHGDAPPHAHDLHRPAFGSTGEPWNTEPLKWFLTHVGGGRIPIINYSGGTEIGGGSSDASRRCCSSGLVPRTRARSLPTCSTPKSGVRGAVGELRHSRTVGRYDAAFWGGDAKHDDDARYLSTLGVWEGSEADAGCRRLGPHRRHRRGRVLYIRGRSDDTINVAGKRSARPSSRARSCRIRRSKKCGDCGAGRLKGRCRGAAGRGTRAGQRERRDARELLAILDRTMGKSLRPKAIHFVDDIPKTRNMKVMRPRRARAVPRPRAGRPGALDNTGSLDAIDRRR